MAIETFMEEVMETSRKHEDPATIVGIIVPKMVELLKTAGDFLTDEHKKTCDEAYARNPLFIADDGSCSLMALCWTPGQWTPIHDHGTWGVVGVYQGVLEEFSFIRTDDYSQDESGIILKRGGSTFLNQGSATSFVPNPDHIHRTGISSYREPTISLHLYGRNMDNYNIYDIDSGTRRHASVAYT